MKIPTTCTKLWAHLLMWLAMLLIPPGARAQTQQMKTASPEPATAAMLAAFDKYEVVGLPAAHGMKDLDDFIFSLIRNPSFSEKVNDIEVECGNSLYQPLLDRYIAGEDVAFTEVRKVWRNTTVSMCGTSGFYEQFFPLVRAINQKLTPGKCLRELAGDPPIDWDQVKDYQDVLKFGANRDANAASVMEKEVLAKRRKAFMLFGVMHLMHSQDRNAVSIYEKDYPGVTFVISDLGYFDTDSPTLSSAVLASWPIPSLARTAGTSLGDLDWSHFYPPPLMINKDECVVHNEFPKGLQRPTQRLVDAFLYLGPQDLKLLEQMPADIAVDIEYRMELRRREALPGYPAVPAGTLEEANQQTVKGAEHPIFIIPRQTRDPQAEKAAVQSCLDLKSRAH
jgi:hypothetical protein